MEYSDIIGEIKGGRTQAEFARALDQSEASVSLLLRGERTPERDTIAALLREATPEQQRELLTMLGMDVEQYEAAILASAGVVDVEVEGTIGGNGNEPQ